MSILILSDVHSNIDALDAVLRDADARAPIDAVWCLGDIVGYGAHPGAVIASLSGAGVLAVAGNHDRAACGLLPTDEFNGVAAAAIEWTTAVLTDDQSAWLAALPLTAISGGFTLAHGSIRAPEWEYLLDEEAADAQFERQTTPYSLVGHSHLPFVVRESATSRFELPDAGTTVDLASERLIINPGSAGQPRDRDPRASYVLYDEAGATVSWHRTEYDIAATQRAIIDAGLPPFLASRLAEGR